MRAAAGRGRARRARRSGGSARRSSARTRGSARRVDADHHRAVDAPRVAPGVDQRRARARALAEQVDPAVAERAARGLEIVDALGQRVAGEVDAVTAKALGAAEALPRTRAVRPRRAGRGLLHRRLDLGAVEHRRAVDAAVADEHDVAVAGEAARVREVHVGEAGAALEAEDRLAGCAERRGCA